MSKSKKDATTRALELAGGTPVKDDATSMAAMSKMMSESSDGSDDSQQSRQAEQDDSEDDEDEDDADEDESDESDDTSEEQDDSEDESDETDDEESEDQDEDGENAENDDGLGDLSHDEAVALARRQQKGVEKLKKRAEDLADELDAIKSENERLTDSDNKIKQWDVFLEDVQTAPRAAAGLVRFIAEKHNLDLAELASTVAKIATHGEDDTPDFEELVEEALQGVEFEYEDDRDRMKQALINIERAKWDRDKKDRDEQSQAKSARTENNSTTDAKVKERFDREFKEAELSFKDDYPDFRLTREMALEAVKTYSKLSVEDACFRLYRKQMTESVVKRVRNDKSHKVHRMPIGTAKQGKAKSLPKDQSKMSLSDMASAMGS